MVAIVPKCRRHILLDLAWLHLQQPVSDTDDVSGQLSGLGWISTHSPHELRLRCYHCSRVQMRKPKCRGGQKSLPKPASQRLGRQRAGPGPFVVKRITCSFHEERRKGTGKKGHGPGCALGTSEREHSVLSGWFQFREKKGRKDGWKDGGGKRENSEVCWRGKKGEGLKPRGR